MKSEPFTNYGARETPLYLISNIAKIVGIPRRTICNQMLKLTPADIVIKTIKVEATRGASIYTQAQTCKLVTLTGLRKILCAVRRPIPREILEYYQITELNRFQCEEAKWLEPILEVFGGEEILLQHAVGPYRLDAYFPKYNLIIEVDEHGHRNYCPALQARRYATLNAALARPYYVRFNPYGDASMCGILGRVYRVIRAARI
jgi:hypothetical protein